MKKTASIIILIALVLTSCKNAKKQEQVNKPKVPAQEQVERVLGTQWINDIQLNNGAKWQANIETTQGVKKMQELLQTQSTLSIKDYHQLASNLNDVKNNLVKECTMKGASHDNLHIWLYPLIQKINALSETNNLDLASKIKQSIEDNINVYSTYFH